jgi:hypothetical protein
MKEAPGSSETSVLTRATRRNNPEDTILQLLNYLHETEWTPFQTHYFSENVVAREIEPGTSGSVAQNPDYYSTQIANARTCK